MMFYVRVIFYTRVGLHIENNSIHFENKIYCTKQENIFKYGILAIFEQKRSISI